MCIRDSVRGKPRRLVPSTRLARPGAPHKLLVAGRCAPRSVTGLWQCAAPHTTLIGECAQRISTPQHAWRGAPPLNTPWWLAESAQGVIFGSNFTDLTCSRDSV
eukprot:TRINITY_DN11169_c0_g1_i1.p2 TRINITY_DN11169_c0_g1~~TRINITY_DN11169_c0_g1_i1.p2  ORF type:complete len:104 (-),score=1.11 TRINITY_DN11169_c0_g1_i1:127-438(-)